VSNIADEIGHRGHAHSSRVLECRETPADENAAEVLGCRVGEPLLHVRLVHFEDGSPIQLEDRYVVPAFAPEFLQQDFTETTPGAYLSSVSPLQEAEHVVRAVAPDAATRRNLAMSDDEPCLVVTRRTWAGGRPVTFARLCHPGSRFELSGHYTPPGADAATGSNPS
jgi:GntR family histidine utilization transcriptional repressor